MNTMTKIQNTRKRRNISELKEFNWEEFSYWAESCPLGIDRLSQSFDGEIFKIL
jgi:hypothetical protein